MLDLNANALLTMRRKLRISATVASVLVVAIVAVASAATTHDNRSSDSDDRKVIVLDLMAPYSG
jgi:hypothetical protein